MRARTKTTDPGVIPAPPRQGLVYHLRKRPDLYLLLIPGVVLTIVFKYLPMYGIVISFQDFNIFDGYFGSPFVGFKHFIHLFQHPYFPRLFRNTLLLGVYSLAWGFWPPILLAILLNEVPQRGYKRVVQSVSYLPHFISTVVVVGILFQFAGSNGLLNNILDGLGLPRQQFFTNARWFRPLYITSGVWQSVGWGSIIYLAALTGIDPNLYEAAVVEGAGRFQRIRFITLPGIMPTVVILFILNVRSVVTVGFEKVYLMYNPAIYETADVFSTYLYRRGILEADYSYATAVGLFNSVVALFLIVLCNRIARALSDVSLW